MKSFTTKIVDMMKKERFFASQGQGGHIILAQVVISDNSGGRPMFIKGDRITLSEAKFVCSRWRMSMEITSKRMELTARHMQRGQLLWLWLRTLVSLGSCASSTMLLNTWLVPDITCLLLIAFCSS